MEPNATNLFYKFTQNIVSYLPNLFAGLLLIVIGAFAGWLVKRFLIRLLIILRFDRLLISLRWGKAFTKADLRYALMAFIGNFGFTIVFLIFLNSAFDAMRLTVLSNLIQNGVLFLPKLLIASLIILLGWVVAAKVSGSVLNALIKEKIQRASLIARFTNFVLLLFFSAMALAEIDLATTIVTIGFATVIVTLCLIAILVTYSNHDTFMKKFLE